MLLCTIFLDDTAAVVDLYLYVSRCYVPSSELTDFRLKVVMNFVYKKGNIGFNTIGPSTLAFLFHLLEATGREEKSRMGSSPGTSSYEKSRMQKKRQKNEVRNAECRKKRACRRGWLLQPVASVCHAKVNTAMVVWCLRSLNVHVERTPSRVVLKNELAGQYKCSYYSYLLAIVTVSYQNHNILQSKHSNTT